MKNAAEVRNKEPTVALNIRELDSFTTNDEILQTIKRVVDLVHDTTKINISKTDSREQVQAFLNVPQKEGDEMMKVGPLSVG